MVVRIGREQKLLHRALALGRRDRADQHAEPMSNTFMFGRTASPPAHGFVASREADSRETTGVSANASWSVGACPRIWFAVRILVEHSAAYRKVPGRLREGDRREVGRGRWRVRGKAREREGASRQQLLVEQGKTKKEQAREGNAAAALIALIQSKGYKKSLKRNQAQGGNARRTGDERGRVRVKGEE